MSGVPDFSREPTLELPASARHNVPLFVRVVVGLMATGLLAIVAMTPLDVYSQTIFAVTVYVVAWIMGRRKTKTVILTLMLVSITTTARYLYWRITTTVGNEFGADLVLSVILLIAELYAIAVMLLSYFQSAYPLKRRPIALPDDPSTWPTVDVYIPTYNEPLDIVIPTVLAAKNLDWPADKIKVYILDDGTRDEFRAYAAKAGVGYIIREVHNHAKAGNVNHAMTQTRGEFIAVFDCDHVPVRSFLQLGMGWVVRDPKIALVQTPHYFYSPDPFERNLGTFKKVPNEGELFYGITQKGNDLWDATFFCGSCAIIRRDAMESVGGMAPETVTEDAHTMLKMHRKGYRAAYLDIPQAAGLATESMSQHIGQRIRWARGMAQIFRIDNPLIKRGLRLSQRLCYTSAMLYFFHGVPRLIFLIAPMAYLFFGAHIFNASAAEILSYALPHLAHAVLTNSVVQGKHRHAFWAEVYETCLSIYIILPTTLALISPKLGSFNVTQKGGVVDKEYFDLRISMPFIVLLLINLGGVGIGAYYILTGSPESEAYAINIGWAMYNVLIIGCTIAVAWEKQQLRAVHRIPVELPAMLRLPSGHTYACKTYDASMTGAAIVVPATPPIAAGDKVELSILGDGEDAPIPGTIVGMGAKRIRIAFEDLDIPAQESLVRAVFSRPSAWTDWDQNPPDRPARALLSIFGFGLRAVFKLPFAMIASRAKQALLIAASGALVAGSAHHASAQPAAPPDDPTRADVDVPADSDDGWVRASLDYLGLTESMRGYSNQILLSIPFYARGDRVMTDAQLELKLQPAADIPSDLQALQVLVNGEEVALIAREDLADTEPRIINIEPQLLGEQNDLRFAMQLDPDRTCPSLVAPGSWQLIAGGELRTKSAPLALASDLELLPLPFYDRFADRITPVGIALLVPRTGEAIKAAGLIASYFGQRVGGRFRFPVTFDGLPDGDAIVIATSDVVTDRFPDLGAVEGPTIAMIDHPDHPGGQHKLLIVTGRDMGEVVQTTQRLAIDFEATKGAGARVTFHYVPTPQPRKPYDANSWHGADGDLVIGEVFPDESARAYQSALGGTITLEWRQPPDVFVWPAPYVTLKLAWTQDGPPGVELPQLKVVMNGYFLGDLPRPTSADERARQVSNLRVPLHVVQGYNKLEIHVVIDEAQCPNIERDVVRTAILPDSRLEIGGAPRFSVLPDVARFVDDGFPFTRMADLNETVIILPNDPLETEVSTALSAMAHTTATTGVAPTAVTVLTASTLDDPVLKGRDLLFVGAADRWPLLRTALPGLPVKNFGTRRLQLADVPWHRHIMAFAQGHPLSGEIDRGRAALAAVTPKALAIGAASPLTPGRSAVILTATRPEAMPSVAELRGHAEAVTPRGDVLVLVNDKRYLLALGPTFDSGQLPAFKRLQWFIANHWLIMVPLLFFVAFLAARIAKRRLAHIAFRRLSEGGDA